MGVFHLGQIGFLASPQAFLPTAAVTWTALQVETRNPEFVTLIREACSNAGMSCCLCVARRPIRRRFFAGQNVTVLPP